MVIVSTLALSLMIGNHWLTPLLLHGAWSSRGRDLRGAVLVQRRIGILAVVLLAWGYSRLIAGNDALADVGALSFSALATLAPAMGFALWRPQTPPRAVIAGIAIAAMAWTVAAAGAGAARGARRRCRMAATGAVEHGMARARRLLRPDRLEPARPRGRRQPVRRHGRDLAVGGVVAARRRAAPGIAASMLRRCARPGLRFLPRPTVERALAGAPTAGAVPPDSEALLERELASVLGSASARLLLDAARREAGRDFDTVAAIVGEASQDLRFNQRLLEAALENMSQGISVVDRDQRLVAWNRRYAELFGYPPRTAAGGHADRGAHRLGAAAHAAQGHARSCARPPHRAACAPARRTSPNACSPTAASSRSAAIRCRAAASSPRSPT